ncbi:Uncharacterised protein [Serratia fonticola]|uniref:Uncharacterized protein n=1 Tax=Serratia fonticola TaxID=47917 RepID=A0A448SNR7_SERFO|nr:Uncharacterised protein [Serratia fonticola]
MSRKTLSFNYQILRCLRCFASFSVGPSLNMVLSLLPSTGI